MDVTQWGRTLGRMPTPLIGQRERERESYLVHRVVGNPCSQTYICGRRGGGAEGGERMPLLPQLHSTTPPPPPFRDHVHRHNLSYHTPPPPPPLFLQLLFIALFVTVSFWFQWTFGHTRDLICF